MPKWPYQLLTIEWKTFNKFSKAFLTRFVSHWIIEYNKISRRENIALEWSPPPPHKRMKRRAKDGNGGRHEQCHPDAEPWGVQDVAHRCEWRAWLVASSPSVPTHTFPKSSPLLGDRRQVSFLCSEYVWKDGKSLCHAFCLWKSETLLWCKASSRIFVSE